MSDCYSTIQERLIDIQSDEARVIFHTHAERFFYQMQ